MLAKHWPDVPCYDDVRTIGAASVEPVEVLCGGFPCQDISLAGKDAGIGGARSGLWAEYARLIGELRPRYVVVENVAALLSRGLTRVLGDLAALGYDAEWDCIPASAVGAPHQRDRLWIVAYPYADCRGLEVSAELDCAAEQDASYGDSRRRHSDGLRDEVADASCVDGKRCERCGDCARRSLRATGNSGTGAPGRSIWAVEPDVGRVANGVPARVDRLKTLGNAIVPQIAEWIGRRIVTYENALEVS